MPHNRDLPLRRLAAMTLVLATCQGSPDIVQNDWVLESRPLITAVTIGPTADAYVRDGTSAGANFGFDPTLQVKTQSGTGNNRVTYLRFPVTALTGPVSNARLRLHGQRAATSTVADVAYGVPSNTWTEGGSLTTTGRRWARPRGPRSSARRPSITNGTSRPSSRRRGPPESPRSAWRWRWPPTSHSGLTASPRARPAPIGPNWWSASMRRHRS